MKVTKSKLKQIIKEELQDRGPRWKAGEGKVPNVDELAEWYWKALMSGQEAFLSQDLGSIWMPLAKGEDLKNIEIPSHTAAEWVKQMDAENVRHYAKGVQNALIQVFKDVLSDKSKIVDPMHGGTDYQSGEKKIAAHQLQKIFDAIGVNPAFARQIPGFEDKYAWKGQQTESKMKVTKSKLKQIIKEEITNALKENVPNPEFRAKVEKGESEKRAKAEKAAEEQALHDAASFKAIESTVPPGQFISGRGRFDFQRAGSTQKEDLVYALYREKHDFSGTPLDEVANWWLTNFPKQDSPLPVGYIAGAFKAQGDLDTMLSEPLNAADQRIKDKMESWR